MKWLLLFAILLLHPSLAAAWCAAPHLPEIDFTISTQPATERFDLGINELMALANGGGLDILENAAVLGLARSNLEIRSTAQFISEQVGERWCAYLDRITINLGFNAPEIFVAKELDPHSCSYAVTLRHERQHIAFDLEMVEEFKGEIRERVYDRLRNLWPVPASDDASAQAALSQLVQQQLSGLDTELRKARKAKHRTLDNPENYRAEAEECGDETYALVRLYLQSPLHQHPKKQMQ